MPSRDTMPLRSMFRRWVGARPARHLFAILIVVGAPTMGAGHSAQAVPWFEGPCADRDAERTGIVQGALQAFLNRDDDVARRVRSERGLPVAPSVVARVVGDAAVCRRLRRAVDSLSGRRDHLSLPQPDSTRAVFVFQVDSMFVLCDLDGVRPETRSDWQVFRPAGIRVGQWR